MKVHTVDYRYTYEVPGTRTVRVQDSTDDTTRSAEDGTSYDEDSLSTVSLSLLAVVSSRESLVDLCERNLKI